MSLDGFELDEEWLTRDEMIERRRVREERTTSNAVTKRIA